MSVVSLGRAAGSWNTRAALVTVAASAGAGLLIARGLSAYLAVALLIGGAFVVGLANWRLSLIGLLFYLPLSGVPVVLAYPHTEAPVLAKDFLFVLPAYVGFAAWAVTERRPAIFRGAPVLAMGLFGLLVLGEMLNPSVPGITVAAIGAKVWLLYIPLFFLAYHLVTTRRDLQRLLRILLLAAAAPIGIGLLEVVLIYAGRGGVVYDFFGSASAAATQAYTQFDYTGGGSLRRIPGTFSFVTQYYGFLVAVVALGYAAWRGGVPGYGVRRGGFVLWVLAVVAALLSGAREAFVMVPLLMLVILVLERPGSLRVILRATTFLVAGAASVAAIGASVGSLFSATRATFSAEWGDLIVKSLPAAVERTWAGFGTGIATGASRYAGASSRLMESLRLPWAESWYAKAVLELGIAGLIVLLALLGIILAQGFRAHLTLKDSELRAVSAALLGFLCWAVLSAAKGPFIDLDPVNVYFWFFAGLLARVHELGSMRLRDPEQGGVLA